MFYIRGMCFIHIDCVYAIKRYLEKSVFRSQLHYSQQ